MEALIQAGQAALSGLASVPQPRVVVQYDARDISADISPLLLSVEYSDYLEDASDSIQLTLEDTARRWQNSWYPEHGARLSLQIGYVNAPLLPCGDFEIDEIEISGAPDTVSIKGLATNIRESVRTNRSNSYRDTTLAAVIAQIAQRNQWQVKGQIEAIPITYLAQAFEHDLAFLKRLCAEYGYSFAKRGAQLSICARQELKKAATILVIERGDVSSYSFKDKVQRIYKGVSLNYLNADSKTVHSSAQQRADGAQQRNSGDTLNLNARAENPQQAQRKAAAALERANENQTTASLELFGNVRLMAGLNVQLQNFGKMDGKYLITLSRHHITRAEGYRTSVELKRHA